MTDIPAFTSFAPGFEFLQGLVKNAGAALPGMGQWVAPTLNPEELDKRIQELKTVQFWLEQNARMLGATIQALEVQKMTLTTLQTMNVQMGDLRDALTIRMPTAARSAMPPEPEAPEEPPSTASEAAAAADTSTDSTTAQPDAKPAVDPMQWWGALTKQFSELAATALKDGAAEAAALVASAASVAPAAKAQKASISTPPSSSVAKKATTRKARSSTAAAPKSAARKPAARAPR